MHAAFIKSPWQLNTTRKLRIAVVVSVMPMVAVIHGLAPKAASQEQRAELYREGQVVRGLQGVIETRDGRFVFESLDKKQRFPILENLALERVARALDDSIIPLVWNVSGTMTEYRGHNFLLLQSARLTERE